MPDLDQFASETTGAPYWTGCNIECDCLARDFIALWEAIREKHLGVWLYEGGAPDEPSGLGPRRRLLGTIDRLPGRPVS